MEDVLDLYAEPYDARLPVVCFGERPCFLIAEVLTPIPLAPGRPQRYDYEYEKNGSANVFGFLEPKTGKRCIRLTERRTKQDFALVMKHLLTELYPTAIKVRLVLDNLNTHTLAALYDTFPAEQARRLARRLEVHVHVLEVFTPNKRSGLNLALQRLQPNDDFGRLVRRQNARLAEPGGVGDGAFEVVPGEALIETDRGVELLY